ncbi:hypothetical protein EG327_009535 [Venturia inaequalis]|uniref:Uncharacterized protein n=1 Tax=Venturia inaequalis TaxID=5025 RepID=A0A8H3ZAY8_VENIN|nr:hypothetical protein EG327_009535 [Venturia inaequalis]
MDRPRTPENSPFSIDDKVKSCSISSGHHVLKCGHQISTVPGEDCGENCVEAGPELFFTCISCTDFVTIQHLVEIEIMAKWKRLSMQGIKLLENSLRDTLLGLGREIVLGRFNARGRGCKQVPPRHADTVKLILAFRLQGIVSALTRVNSVADIKPELLLFCSDFMVPTPIHLEAHLNELCFMERKILESPLEFRTMMAKKTTMEYLFLMLLEEGSLKRMVEGHVDATQSAMDTELQPNGQQRRPVDSFLRSQTGDLRSVSPTPSFKEARLSGSYYQPHPDNETSSTRSRPLAWKYEDRKFDTPTNGKFEKAVDGRFDSPMDGKFDTPMQGIAPIPFRLGGVIGNTGSTPETSAGRKLTLAATREVSKVNSKPSGRFPRIQNIDTAISSRIRVPAKLARSIGKETEKPVPKSNNGKGAKAVVAGGIRRKTVDSGYGQVPNAAAAAAAAAKVTGRASAGQLRKIPKVVAPAGSRKGNSRSVPSSPSLRKSSQGEVRRWR